MDTSINIKVSNTVDNNMFLQRSRTLIKVVLPLRSSMNGKFHWVFQRHHEGTVATFFNLYSDHFHKPQSHHVATELQPPCKVVSGNAVTVIYYRSFKYWCQNAASHSSQVEVSNRTKCQKVREIQSNNEQKSRQNVPVAQCPEQLAWQRSIHLHALLRRSTNTRTSQSFTASKTCLQSATFTRYHHCTNTRSLPSQLLPPLPRPASFFSLPDSSSLHIG